jgi:DNA-binding MarR family transcriptional regulator
VSESDNVGVIVRLAKVLEIVLADLGLTMNQFRLLTLVEERSPSAAELSRRLVMKPPNVSALTAGLVKRGLIRQHKQDDDGRRRRLELTTRGVDLVAHANKDCARALLYLSAESPSGSNPFVALKDWLPALDEAAVRLRQEADERT